MAHQYPSEEELAEIIARRRQLLRAVIRAMATSDGNQRKVNKQMDGLVRQHGQAEVERIAAHLQNTFQRDLANDEAWLYHEYVKYYRRFGGRRPFLTLAEYTESSDEFSTLYGRQEIDQSLSADEEQRLAELNHLLLKDAYLWEDLLPAETPADMPEVELPPLKTDSTPTSANKRRCKRDGFPMRKINGRRECVVEYIDRASFQVAQMFGLQFSSRIHTDTPRFSLIFPK